MEFIGFVIAGLVIGALAKLVMPGDDPGGIFVTALLGMAGALVGGWIGRAAGFYGPSQPAGWLISIAGAVILLALYRMLMAPRRRAI